MTAASPQSEDALSGGVVEALVLPVGHLSEDKKFLHWSSTWCFWGSAQSLDVPAMGTFVEKNWQLPPQRVFVAPSPAQGRLAEPFLWPSL